MRAYRNADPVVADCDRAIWADDHGDIVAATGHCFIDGVVDNLPNQVMQAPGGRVANVHAGAFANRLQTT